MKPVRNRAAVPVMVADGSRTESAASLDTVSKGEDPFRRALSIVEQPLVRCTECRHRTKIYNVWRHAHGYLPETSFAYLACKKRAFENVPPHDTRRNIEWDDWKTERWNADGTCRLYERRLSWMERVLLWWRRGTSRRKGAR